MYRFALIEDRQEEADNLVSVLNRFFQEAGNKEEYSLERFVSGEDFLKSYRPIYQVVFMDIDLPGENGYQASQQLRKIDEDVLLVFTTRLANYALHGYEVSAFDFMVKPYEYPIFKMKMDRILKKLSLTQEEKIEVMDTDRQRVVLPVSHIQYIEVMNHNVLYHTSDGIFHSRQTLSSVEEKLKEKGFAKPNNYSLVNLRMVKNVKQEVIDVNGTSLRMSRSKKKEFLDALAKYYGSTR